MEGRQHPDEGGFVLSGDPPLVPLLVAHRGRKHHGREGRSHVSLSGERTVDAGEVEEVQ